MFKCLIEKVKERKKEERSNSKKKSFTPVSCFIISNHVRKLNKSKGVRIGLFSKKLAEIYLI